MKNGLKKAVAVSLLTVVVAGCGNTGNQGTTNNGGETAQAGSGEKPTLTFWMKKQLFDDQNTLITERAKQFGEENNVNVNVELIAYEDFYPKWTAAIESKSVPDVPLRLSGNWPILRKRRFGGCKRCGCQPARQKRHQ